MKRVVTIIAVTVLVGTCLLAELLDRIAITVGSDVITEQEIYEQIRIASFLNGVEPTFTQPEIRDTADRIVLQRLLFQDMRANGFPLPTEAEVQALLEDFQKRHWGSPEEFRESAQEADIRTEAIDDFLRRMVGTLKYIDFRFKPAVMVSDSALFERYQQQYGIPGPDEKEPPALEDVRQAIEQDLVGESVDEVVDNWLEDAKERAGVRYKPEVIP